MAALCDSRHFLVVSGRANFRWSILDLDGHLYGGKQDRID